VRWAVRRAEREHRPGTHFVPRLVVTCGAALGGLVLAFAALSAVSGGGGGGGGSPGGGPHPDGDGLRGVVAADRADVDRSRARLAQLRAAGAGPPPTAAAPRPGPALVAAAGLAAAQGAAVTVTLDDTPRERRAGPWEPGVREPVPDDLVVHQQDVQAVVNALWSGGARAMTIMGRRVTARTAVRCVGNTLRLEGGVYAPPFVIAAIGDRTRLTAAVADDPDVALYRQYVDAYGLGYRVQEVADATFPAATPPPVRYATPLPR